MESQNPDGIIMKDFLLTLQMGEPATFRNLTVFPLFSNCAEESGYTLLDEAISTKKFRVTEVSEGGQVLELNAVNQLDTDVLIIDGEQLIGAKQNRIVNTSIIVGKGSKVVVPVSCVEQGRWRYKSRTFSSSGSNLYSDLRRKKSKAVYASLRRNTRFEANQREIWDDISMKARRFEVASDTDAMSDIFDSCEEEIGNYGKSFNSHPDQVGFMAFIGDHVAGADIFGYKSVLPKIYDKLIRGYILDAVDEDKRSLHLLEPRVGRPGDGESLHEKVKHFIDSIANAGKETFKSAGEGTDTRFESGYVHGFALVNNREMVHMAAFRQ